MHINAHRSSITVHTCFVLLWIQPMIRQIFTQVIFQCQKWVVKRDRGTNLHPASILYIWYATWTWPGIPVCVQSGEIYTRLKHDLSLYPNSVWSWKAILLRGPPKLNPRNHYLSKTCKPSTNLFWICTSVKQPVYSFLHVSLSVGSLYSVFWIVIVYVYELK